MPTIRFKYSFTVEIETDEEVDCSVEAEALAPEVTAMKIGGEYPTRAELKKAIVIQEDGTKDKWRF